MSQDGRHLLISRTDSNYEWDLTNRQFVRSVAGRKSSIQLAADGRHAFYRNADTGKIDILDLITGQSSQTSVAAISTDIRVGLVGVSAMRVLPPTNRSSTFMRFLPTHNRRGREASRNPRDMSPLALSEHGDTLATLQSYKRIDLEAAANAAMNVAGGVLSFGAGLPGFSLSPSLVGVPLKPIETLNTTAGAANIASQSAGPFTYADSRLVIWDVPHQRHVMTINRPDLRYGCPTCIALNSPGNLLIINREE